MLRQISKGAESSFDVRLSELTSEQQARALLGGELDVAICFETDELKLRDDLDFSVVTTQPYVLVVPAHALENSVLSRDALSSLLYVHPAKLARAGDVWLGENGLEPSRRVECRFATEIIAYAGAGYGYGFVPQLWSVASGPDVAFAPAPGLSASARVVAYNLRSVSANAHEFREKLAVGAQQELQQFRRR